MTPKQQNEAQAVVKEIQQLTTAARAARQLIDTEHTIGIILPDGTQGEAIVITIYPKFDGSAEFDFIGAALAGE